MKYYLPILIILLFCSSCNTPRSLQVNESDPIERLEAMIIGSYTSEAQSLADSTYFNISLQMYPIWQDRPEAKYLYVEQAVTANPDKPYRQRVYKIERVDAKTIGSKVYTLDEPDQYIGKWKTPEYFDDLDPSILSERKGCTVFLVEQADGTYTGSTNAKDCKSTLRGASYGTSVVTIYPDKIV